MQQQFGALVVDGGVRFRVHAPLARRVLLNVHDGPARGSHPMAHGQDGVWDRFVPGAAAGHLYGLSVDDGTTLPEHFCSPPSLTVPEGSRLKNISLRELIADIEKRIIVQTLERVDGSQKRAAEELRLNPTTLHEKMKRYKILPAVRRQRA